MDNQRKESERFFLKSSIQIEKPKDGFSAKHPLRVGGRAARSGLGVFFYWMLVAAFFLVGVTFYFIAKSYGL